MSGRCHDKTALARVVARGDAYTVGCELGTRSRAIVHDYLRTSPSWKRAMSWCASPRLAEMRGLVDRCFPRYVEELTGLADGAGISIEEAFAWHCRGDLPGVLVNEGCTTVIAEGQDGLLIAHNEDGDPVLKPHCFLMEAMPDQGRGFTAFTYPGSLPGQAFGVNDAGLVQTVNNLRCHVDTVGIPRMILARAVLDCGSIDEAVSLLTTAQRAGGYHHVLAQAGRGRAVSLETMGHTISAEEVMPPFAHTNHILSPAIGGTTQHVTESSAMRQVRASALCADLPVPASVSSLLRILNDRADTGFPIYRTDPDDTDGENNLAAVIFEVGREAISCSVHISIDERIVFET